MNAIFESLSESVPYIHEEVSESITTKSFDEVQSEYDYQSDEDFVSSVW